MSHIESVIVSVFFFVGPFSSGRILGNVGDIYFCHLTMNNLFILCSSVHYNSVVLLYVLFRCSESKVIFGVCVTFAKCELMEPN